MFTKKKDHMRNIKMIAALSMAASLVACGGGDEPQQNASAEGFWNGTDSSILITSTGELWGVEVVGSSLALYKGTVSTNGSSFSAQLAGYLGSQKVDGTASGTVVPQKTLQGTVSASGQTPSSFSLTYDATYNQLPNLAALAGNYADSTGGTFTVATNGAFSGANSLGCTESGTITPDTSGKNFYRVVLTIGQDSACGSFAGRTATGVLGVAGSNMLVGGVVLGNLGDAFLLTKQ